MKAKIINNQTTDGVKFGLLIDDEYFECDKLSWRIKCALGFKKQLGQELQISIPNQLTDAEEYSLTSTIRELINKEEDKEIKDETKLSALKKLGTILDIEL